jgi:hypothetical protein
MTTSISALAAVYASGSHGPVSEAIVRLGSQ